MGGIYVGPLWLRPPIAVVAVAHSGRVDCPTSQRSTAGFGAGYSPALRAPAAVRDAVGNGEIQRGTVSAGLSAGNDSLKHCGCIHFASKTVETQMQRLRLLSGTLDGAPAASEMGT